MPYSRKLEREADIVGLQLASKVKFTSQHTGLVVRVSDSGWGDPGSILGRVGVLFP